MHTIPFQFVKRLAGLFAENSALTTPLGKQLDYGNRKDFLFLPDSLSARHSFTRETVLGGVFCLLVLSSALALFYITFELHPLLTLTSIVVFLNAGLVLFKLFVIGHAGRASFIPVSKKDVSSLPNTELPHCTIFVPLLNEAAIMEQIAGSLRALDYPEEKLQILLTFEEYDVETMRAFRDLRLPAHFREIILPDCAPKSKPKALNVALLYATGEFFVIFDAEVMPDKDQLKRAALAFKKRPDIACLQTRLEHYNAEENALTRLFNMEFACYYDYFLPGLQRLGFPIPLSGHSVYFRASAIRAIGGWDPYNMAEDCDIGMRLFRNGFKTGMIDSMSREEAVPDIRGWVRQRTRWMKGFIQSSITPLRHPISFAREIGISNFLAFLFLVPGTVFFNLLNFLCWLIFALWLLFHPLFIKSLYPGPVLAVAVLAFAIGSIVFVYLNLISAYNRGRYGFVKYGLLTPLYWILLSYATARALVQLFTTPHVWEKTSHSAHPRSQRREPYLSNSFTELVPRI